MGNDYIKTKAKLAAAGLVRKHGLDFAAAYSISQRLWREARKSILKIIGTYGTDRWQKLSLRDKAEVCSIVVRGLLDKKKVLDFMEGKRKGIL